MATYIWKFNSIPTAQAVENFIDNQIPLFARYTNYLNGADGQPIVDIMKVEHNNGAINLEFQLNGTMGHAGEIFCFPGYYPGDLDDQGNPLTNHCDTGRHFYGKVVAMVLHRAREVFDMEYTTSVKKAQQYQNS